MEGGVFVIGRVLHDVMELGRHLNADQHWKQVVEILLMSSVASRPEIAN
jgi:hypothetical protein